MCGILGIAAAGGHTPTLDTDAIVRLRDRMSHRGPDGSGLTTPMPGVILAHRRLSIVDPTGAGAQPMRTSDGRYHLAYNGMLYNDAEVRAELARSGVDFRSSCDTETVLHALAHWGTGAFARLRGMYSVALIDTVERSLLLARDPLGIKPLFFSAPTSARAEVRFASDLATFRAFPGESPAPDLVTASAYLTTIRNTLDDRTLLAGVRTVRPGEWVRFDLASDRLAETRGSTWPAVAERLADPVFAVRDTVEESVRLHCRADVPVCALLSGGLDSAITVSIARKHVADLRTYCAGDPNAAPIAGVPQSEDFAHARLVAEHLGTRHTEVPINEHLFASRWPELVARTGAPLSTPNEIAIHEVARVLAADGHKVTISGEGADELFAGYAAPMAAAAAHIASGNAEPGLFQLHSNAWTPIDMKPAIFRREAWDAVDSDRLLAAVYQETFASISRSAPEADPLEEHLRFHRRVNLAGLLARLDTSTMLASVEGRTPLADATLARVAEVVPMDMKFQMAGDRVSTKRVLREAFARELPAEVVGRPKASFPLPFQNWMGWHAERLFDSSLVRSLCTDAAIAAVAADPSGHWALAWPLINLAIWDTEPAA